MLIVFENRQTSKEIWTWEISTSHVTRKIFRRIIVELFYETANVTENNRLRARVILGGKEVLRVYSADEACSFVVWVARNNDNDISEVYRYWKEVA